MKKEIITSLLILTIIALILTYGCGGGNDGVTQPSSILNTKPTDTTNDSNNNGLASIRVRVYWPESKIDKNEIEGAYIPWYSDEIRLEVFEYNPDDPGDLSNRIDYIDIPRESGETTVGKLENIPCVKVYVRATALKNKTEVLDAIEEKQLEVGTNDINLTLRKSNHGMIQIHTLPMTKSFIMIPDFQSNYFRNKDETEILITLKNKVIETPFSEANAEKSLNGQIFIETPPPDDIFDYTDVPLANKKIIVEILSGNATIANGEVITDENGQCWVTVQCDPDCIAGDEVEVLAKFVGEDGEVLSEDTMTLVVYDNLAFEDNFDQYTPGDRISELTDWGVQVKSCSITPFFLPLTEAIMTQRLWERNIFVGSTAVQLYGLTQSYNDHGYHIPPPAEIFKGGPGRSHIELRLDIVAIGDEPTSGLGSERARIDFNNLKMLTLLRDGTVLNCIGEPMRYPFGGEIRIQVIEGSTSTKVIYGGVNEIVIDADHISTLANCLIGISSNGGSLVVDNVRIYSLDGLPSK